MTGILDDGGEVADFSRHHHQRFACGKEPEYQSTQVYDPYLGFAGSTQWKTITCASGPYCRNPKFAFSPEVA